MKPKARHDWTPEETRAVAVSIVDTAKTPIVTVDEIERGLESERAPALAIFGESGECVFFCGLWPFDEAEPRGILHAGGNGTLPEAWRVVKDFLCAMPTTEVLAFVDSPALGRLCRWIGMTFVGERAFGDESYAIYKRFNPF